MRDGCTKSTAEDPFLKAELNTLAYRNGAGCSSFPLKWDERWVGMLLVKPSNTS